MTSHKVETLLTPADVARLAGVVPATVVNAADRGDIEVAATTPGGNRLFRRVEAERYVRERAARSDP